MDRARVGRAIGAAAIAFGSVLVSVAVEPAAATPATSQPAPEYHVLDQVRTSWFEASPPTGGSATPTGAPATVTGPPPTGPARIVPFRPTDPPPDAAGASPMIARDASPQTASSAQTLTALASFPAMSLDRQLMIANDQFVTPPDTQIAVGPTQVVEMVNNSMSIWTKDGRLVAGSAVDLNRFFGVPTGFLVSDPRVVYDAPSGRWFASIFASDSASDSNVYLAVSATSDPTGAWKINTVTTTTAVLTDQPKLGISDDKVVISWNDFNPSLTGGETWVLQKGDLLAGRAPTTARFPADPSRVSLAPAVSLTPTTTEFAVFNDVGNARLGLVAFTGTPAQGNVTLTAAGFDGFTTHTPPSADQPGLPSSIQTNDTRLLSAEWANGVLWTGGNDACIPSGDSTVRPCARVAEVLTNTNPMSLAQNGDLGVVGGDVYFPSPMADSFGNVIVGFTESSSMSTGDPSVMTMALPASGGGSIVGPTVQAGQDTYDERPTQCWGTSHASRWGDYSASARDPSNPSRVWVAGEYAAHSTAPGLAGCDWATAVGELAFVGPVSASTSTVTASPSSAPADGASSSTVTVTLNDANSNPVAGKTVGLSQGAGHSTITAGSATTNAAGQAIFSVKSTTAGPVTYSATDTTDGVPISQTATVTFFGPVSGSTSTVTASPSIVPADGSTASTVTVTLFDANSNPVAGKTVSLSQGSGHSTITGGSPTTNAAGQVIFTVTDATREFVTYTATDSTDGTTIAQTATVAFASAVSGVSATPNPSSAGATASYTVAFTTSAAGAIGPGGTVTLSGPPGTGFSNTATDYTVTGSVDTVGSVATSAVNGSATPNQVVMTLSASGITASDRVTVVAARVANPSTPAAGLTLSAATSTDALAQASAPYTITAPPVGGGGGGGGTNPTTTTTSTTVAAGPRAVTQIYGPDRIQTAIAASADTFPSGGAHAVVLARADDFADAICGTPLAVAQHAPLLFTGSTALDPATETEIKRVLAPGGTVDVLGGGFAIAPAVTDALTADGYQVNRLAGPTRFDTAVVIAKAVGTPRAVLVATGMSPGDALSAGAAAAVNGGVVVLTNGSGMPAATAAYLNSVSGVRQFAVGGPSAAADPSAVALVGSDRYTTSVVVAQRFFSSPTTLGFANGFAFPDALAGGTSIAAKGGPLLLIAPVALPTSVHDYVVSIAGGGPRGVVYGGGAVVPSSEVSAIAAALGGT